MKLFYALIVLLFASLFVGLVGARGGTFVINPNGETIEETPQLWPPDSVFGNLSVSGGFVRFFVTNPSNETIYENLKTSSDQFNFTADENGTFQMHFVNEYQSENVSVSLSYSINFFIFVSEEIHISTSIFTTQTTMSNGIIITHIQSNPGIRLNVNPPGFPVPGQYWQISVFSASQSPDGRTYLTSLPNATVLVKYIDENRPMAYSSTTDEEGHLEFQFLSQYSDVSFQAISGENKSDIWALTQQAEHYVSTDSVNSIFILSGVMSGITALSLGVPYFRKRTRVIIGCLIGAVLGFSMFLLVISTIAKFFWLTPWGYSENIFYFLTWTLLEYAIVGGIILYAFLALLAFILGRRKPD